MTQANLDHIYEYIEVIIYSMSSFIEQRISLSLLCNDFERNVRYCCISLANCVFTNGTSHYALNEHASFQMVAVLFKSFLLVMVIFNTLHTVSSLLLSEHFVLLAA